MENSTKIPSKYKDLLLRLIQGPDGAIWSRNRVNGWTADSDDGAYFQRASDLRMYVYFCV